MAPPLKIGIAGLGTVGASVVRLIDGQRDALVARCGRPIEVVAVSARSRGKKRNLGRKSPRWVADPVTLSFCTSSGSASALCTALRSRVTIGAGNVGGPNRPSQIVKS